MIFNTTKKETTTPLSYNSGGVNISWLPKTVTRWENIINENGKKYNIDPELIAIIITVESGGYSKALSRAKAQGLMQVIPPTANDIAKKHLIERRQNFDIYDPKTNVEFGTAYLSYLRNEFGQADQGPTWNSTVELIAAGYNGGPGAANSLFKGQGLKSNETLVYSRDVFNMWRERKAQTSPTFERWKQRGGSLLIEKAENEK